MIRRIYTSMIVGLIAGMVLLTGCKREYGTVTLGANIDNGRDAKVYIDDLTPCWHNNDLIRVNNQTCTTSAALGSSAQITDVVESNHYRAIYPVDIVGGVDISNSSTIAVTLPRVQLYEIDNHGDQKVRVPMGAYSSSESLTFHNLCSMIKVVISSRMAHPFLLDSIRITASNSYLSGLGVATVVGQLSDEVEMIGSMATTHEVSLSFPTTDRPAIVSGDRDSYVYYIFAPEFEEDDVTITLYSNGCYAIFEKVGVSLLHNRMATVSLTVEALEGQDNIDGLLPGWFSVGPDLRVRFSQGNLQYMTSTNTWRFAEHQWDYVGTQSADGEGYYGGTVSGSDNNNNYGWNDVFSSGDQFIDTISISNGGAINSWSTGWRKLTGEEWHYLFYERTHASAKYGTGNINGVGGMIILPDNFVLPSGCTFYAGLASTFNDWTRNSYTLAQWQRMEAAGTVFLPAGGCLDYPGLRDAGVVGYYWASGGIDDTPNPPIPQLIRFSSEYIGLATYWDPGPYLSIRLIRY